MSVSQKIPKFVYYAETVTIADGTNDEFVFTEGGGNLTATITSGTYTWGQLAHYVKVALEAAGAGTYTVTYSHSTRKYTITKSAGTFTLDVGAAGGDDALPTLGFTSDKSGALTYTSDSAVPSSTSITCTQRSRFLECTPITTREDTDFESGIRESAHYGDSHVISFLLEFETATVNGYLHTMWRTAGRYGTSIDYYPDSTSSDYISVTWDQKQYPMRGMARSRGLYQRYEGEFAFRVKVPAGGSLDPDDFVDLQ